LIANWKNEVKRFTPNLNILTSYGGAERFKALEQIENADIFLTPYALIYRDNSNKKFSQLRPVF
jgi:SNF2 family DNA or RNA helicase